MLLFSNQTFAKDDIVIQVNKTKISSKYYEQYKTMRIKQSPSIKAGKIDDLVKSELVNRELLYQDAVKNKLNKSKEVIFQLEVRRKEVLVKAAIQKIMETKPITDSDVKKEYDINVAKAAGQEYKARHIIVKTEQVAKDIIEQLNKGGDFVKLATEKSSGPSAKKGGDLGWFPANQMVPAFAKAIKNMKKGTYSKAPVKTRFGYHIIKLENIRISSPPEFDQVKDRLKIYLQNKKLAEYIGSLKKSAKITVQ